LSWLPFPGSYAESKTRSGVNGHDFPSGVPRAIPYGVYDVGADDGFVTVGVDHDTAGFAVNAIRTWWNTVGRDRYPDSSRLLATADCGGSNGSVATEAASSRERTLAEFDDLLTRTGLAVRPTPRDAAGG
jgi:hypothetical protein